MTISYDNIRLIYEDEKNISILSIVQKRFNLGVAKDNQSYYNRNIYQNILSNNVYGMLLLRNMFSPSYLIYILPYYNICLEKNLGN